LPELSHLPLESQEHDDGADLLLIEKLSLDMI
ncbi:hypothetical protein TNCV_4746811, partial [Trichonephila clavipes]